MRDIQEAYRKGLKDYLLKKNEESLTKAYNTSRMLIQEGGSELDIITFHHELLKEILDMDGKLDQASAYLKEWIVPFEMKIQGYRALVSQLNDKNRELEKEIEERKKVQEELADKNAYFESLIENAQDIITVLNLTGKIQFDSPSVERILGFRPNELVAQNAFQFIHEDDIDRVKQIFKEIKADPKYVRSAEFRFRHKAGHWVYLESLAKYVPNSPEGAIVVINSRDITKQKERESKLRKYSERLRKLSERVEQAREEERIRIAREIHDELGQMLTVLKMDVSMMNTEIRKQASDETLEYFKDESAQILERINTIINSVQRIITELRPQVLDRLGLVEALKWQANEFEKRTNLNIEVRSELSETDFLDDKQTTTLFRIFQEAMNNVIRHAEASEVLVKIKRTKDKLVLAVEDNGKGITEDQKQSSTSFGIIGMYERSRSLGGEVQIDTDKGKGTRVTVTIPLEERITNP